jgi:hypothetical protein
LDLKAHPFFESYGNCSFLQDEKFIGPSPLFAKGSSGKYLLRIAVRGDDFQVFVAEPLKDFDIPDSFDGNHFFLLPPGFF